MGQLNLKHYLDKYDALSYRERLLVVGACLVLLHLIWSYLLWEPMNRDEARIMERINNTQQSIKVMEVELQGLVARARNNPNQALIQQIERLESEMTGLQARVEQAAASLVSPTEMARLLEEILLKNGSLRLVGLRTLDSEPLLGDPDESGSGEVQQDTLANAVFRHRFELEFEGDYLSTLEYLRSLEALPWIFFWDGIEFEVDQHPSARVRLNLHTLSLSEGWIGV